jgi:hypothetical protein
VQTMTSNCARRIAHISLPERGGVASSRVGKDHELASHIASLRTCDDRSSKIVLVAFRSIAKSGNGPRLRPIWGQTEDVPVREATGTPGKDVDDATLASAGMAGQDWAQDVSINGPVLNILKGRAAARPSSAK